MLSLPSPIGTRGLFGEEEGGKYFILARQYSRMSFPGRATLFKRRYQLSGQFVCADGPSLADERFGSATTMLATRLGILLVYERRL